jgi:hypothetical protein
MLSQENYEQDRGYFVGTGGDGSERYYVNEGDEADGPGGDIVTYPPEQARHSTLAPYNVPGQRDSHFATTLPSRSYTDEAGLEFRSESDTSSQASSPGLTRNDESRYSRDYQFTIASPDEEMHGKAVALFDFQRENENELPLVEGQVIWVSYRHGQGWLVAEDPRTRESGLVPEEYVRLLRDIQGGLNSLVAAQPGDQLVSPLGPTPERQHKQNMAKYRDKHQKLNKLKHAGTRLSQAMGPTDISSLLSLHFRPLPRIYTLIHNIYWAHKPVKPRLKLFITMGNEGEAKPTLQHCRLLRKVLMIGQVVWIPKTGGKMTV